jgi:hypothetical protein
MGVYGGAIPPFSTNNMGQILDFPPVKEIREKGMKCAFCGNSYFNLAEEEGVRYLICDKCSHVEGEIHDG